MGSFANGVLVGLGLSLLFAPKKGEEMRHLVGERLSNLRGRSSEQGELQQPLSQMRQQVSEIQERTPEGLQMSAAPRGTVQETMHRVDPSQHNHDRLGPDTRSE